MSMPAVFGAQGWSDIPCIGWSGLPAAWDRSGSDRSKPFRLGFCWRAEENSSPIRTKSLPVEVASQVTAFLEEGIKGVEIYSLSPERKDLYNTDSFEHPDGVALEFEHMREWRDTARYLCSMDFVLTVDTAVAHLCGLLGVPALVLVPAGGCWRWGVTEETVSHWYGPDLTLYRQPVALEWNATDIVNTLLERIESLNAANA